MPTLATAMLDLAKILTHVHPGVTTGAGTTMTLVDSNLYEPDDHFNGGLLWILSGAAAGKLRRITDYVKTTSTITMVALPAVPGVGAMYAACGPEYTQEKLITAINQALGEHLCLPAEDTTLVGVADQLDYSLPTGVSNVLQVEIARQDTTPYYFAINHHWDELPTGVLRFGAGYEPREGMPVRITYRAPFAYLDDPETDTISNYINMRWLAWASAVYALRDRMREEGHDNNLLAERLNEAKIEERSLHNSTFLRQMRKTTRWSDLG